MLSREVTNAIRYVLDELVPPVLRDSRVFMFPFFCVAYRFTNIAEIMAFKERVHAFSEEEYVAFYAQLNSISRHRDTDLNRACINEILKEVAGADSLLDAGCGSGFLLGKIGGAFESMDLFGCDVIPKPDGLTTRYIASNIQKMPFADNSFDVVICSHTLEHVVDIRVAMSELLRVARRKLIIVVPCQRYYFYTLDEHLNFFPSREQLVLQMGLHPQRILRIEKIKGDWFSVIEP